MKLFKRLTRWLQFNPLGAATADEWNDWTRQFKKQAPIRYKLFGHSGLFRKVQWAIKRLYSDFFLFFAYRTYDKYHVVPTKLKPGYYDVDTRMLHSCFALLEIYIAVDKGSKQYWAVKREKGVSRKYWKYKIPFVYDLMFNEPQLGLDYLAWEMSLSDEDGGGGQKGNWTQRQSAQEQYDLYIWWTVTRPNRNPIPYPQQLLDYDNKHKEDISFVLSNKFKIEQPELYEIERKYWEQDSLQEQQWRDEDDQMLQRLVALRRHLW